MAKLFASETSMFCAHAAGPDSRRPGVLEGTAGRALLPRRQDHRDLRGHQRDPAPGHRPAGAGPALGRAHAILRVDGVRPGLRCRYRRGRRPRDWAGCSPHPARTPARHHPRTSRTVQEWRFSLRSLRARQSLPPEPPAWTRQAGARQPARRCGAPGARDGGNRAPAERGVTLYTGVLRVESPQAAPADRRGGLRQAWQAMTAVGPRRVPRLLMASISPEFALAAAAALLYLVTRLWAIETFPIFFYSDEANNVWYGEQALQNGLLGR